MEVSLVVIQVQHPDTPPPHHEDVECIAGVKLLKT